MNKVLDFFISLYYFNLLGIIWMVVIITKKQHQSTSSMITYGLRGIEIGLYMRPIVLQEDFGFT